MPYYFTVLLLFFPKVLVHHIQPKDPANGLQYQKTLLGAVLSISCLLKTPGVVEGHGYFLNPSRSSAQETKVQEANIHQVNRLFSLMWLFCVTSIDIKPLRDCQTKNALGLMMFAPLTFQFMGQFHDKLHQILKNLLQRSGETRHLLLSWLGSCLQANAGRAKIWANQMPEIFSQMYASDAFFLNLGATLLKLCQPFCKPRSNKLLTFNPTYCALKELSEEERRNRNVHITGSYEWKWASSPSLFICFFLGFTALPFHNCMVPNVLYQVSTRKPVWSPSPLSSRWSQRSPTASWLKTSSSRSSPCT